MRTIICFYYSRLYFIYTYIQCLYISLYIYICIACRTCIRCLKKNHEKKRSCEIIKEASSFRFSSIRHINHYAHIYIQLETCWNVNHTNIVVAFSFEKFWFAILLNDVLRWVRLNRRTRSIDSSIWQIVNITITAL